MVVPRRAVRHTAANSEGLQMKHAHNSQQRAMLKRWGFHGGQLLVQLLESVPHGAYKIQAQANDIGEVKSWNVEGGPGTELSLPMIGVVAGDGVRVKITGASGEWDSGWFRVQNQRCPHCGKSLIT